MYCGILRRATWVRVEPKNSDLACCVETRTIGEMDRKVLENRGKLVHASRCHTFHKVCIWEQTWNDTGPILLGAFHLYSAGLVSIGCEDFLRFRLQLWFSIYLFLVKFASPDVFNNLGPLFLQCLYCSNHSRCKYKH